MGYVQRAKMAKNLAADFIRQGVAGVLYQPIELIQPCTQIAATAFERLVQRMANPGLAPMTFALPVELIVRDSTRRPAKVTSARGGVSADAGASAAREIVV